MFRSTGSYEPDPLDAKMSSQVNSFDPQALTSLTGDGKATILEVSSFDPQALTSLTNKHNRMMFHQESFDPQALTSLTMYHRLTPLRMVEFRSTGSYEPDQ